MTARHPLASVRSATASAGFPVERMRVLPASVTYAQAPMVVRNRGPESRARSPGVAATAHAAAPATTSRKGVIPSHPWPRPTSVTMVCVKSPSWIRRNHSLVPSEPTSGCVAVAIVMRTSDTATRAATMDGTFRYTSPRGKIANGTAR